LALNAERWIAQQADVVVDVERWIARNKQTSWFLLMFSNEAVELAILHGRDTVIYLMNDSHF